MWSNKSSVTLHHDTTLRILLRALELMRLWVERASAHIPACPSPAGCEARLRFNHNPRAYTCGQTYRRFWCTEVHRERNTVEDPFWHIGPVSYRRVNSSSSEKKQKQLISQSRFHSCGFVTICCLKLVKQNNRNSYFSRWKSSFSCPFFSLSKSAPVSSGLSTRRHVGEISAVTNCKHHRRP